MNSNMSIILIKHISFHEEPIVTYIFYRVFAFYLCISFGEKEAEQIYQRRWNDRSAGNCNEDK